MEQGRGMPAHQVLGLEPEAMLAHHLPEGHERLGVQLTAGVGQCLQLLGFADLHPPDRVHADPFRGIAPSCENFKRVEEYLSAHPNTSARTVEHHSGMSATTANKRIRQVRSVP